MTTTIFNRDIRNGNDERFSGINRRNLLRVIAIAGVIVIGWILLVSIVRVTRINAGYVGVEVNLAAGGVGRGRNPAIRIHRQTALHRRDRTGDYAEDAGHH